MYGWLVPMFASLFGGFAFLLGSVFLKKCNLKLVLPILFLSVMLEFALVTPYQKDGAFVGAWILLIGLMIFFRFNKQYAQQQS
jgi:uncharacterized membrane protein